MKWILPWGKGEENKDRSSKHSICLLELRMMGKWFHLLFPGTTCGQLHYTSNWVDVGMSRNGFQYIPSKNLVSDYLFLYLPVCLLHLTIAPGLGKTSLLQFIYPQSLPIQLLGSSMSPHYSSDRIFLTSSFDLATPYIKRD